MLTFLLRQKHDNLHIWIVNAAKIKISIIIIIHVTLHIHHVKYEILHGQ